MKILIQVQIFDNLGNFNVKTEKIIKVEVFKLTKISNLKKD